MNNNHVVKVWSGLGSLTAVAYLATYGFGLGVFNCNRYPGDYACSYHA